VILCDTGPLVALIDQDDEHHRRCVDTLESLPPEDLLTTWPCLTEAMHLLWRAGGIAAQDELWDLLANGLVRLHSPEPNEWLRLRALMQQYHDLPTDLADASLVALAEHTNERRIFTIDDHFRVYRMHGSQHFTVVP
jgi:predicted nucleic acid-binding protein